VTNKTSEVLPFQEGALLPPPKEEETQTTRDLSQEVLMVRTMEINSCNDDNSLERVNLDDYCFDDFNEYLSDDNMQTTATTMEVTTNINHESSHPPPSIIVKIEEEDSNIEKERHKNSNQKRAEHRQRILECYQEEAGESYDYSNNDLRNVINIGHDAHTVIISKHQEHEDSSRAHIFSYYSAFLLHKLRSVSISVLSHASMELCPCLGHVLYVQVS